MTDKNALDEEQEEEEYKPYNISSISPSGKEVEEQIPVNQKDYWSSIEQTRLAFKEKGYDVALYNEEVLGGNRKLGENIGARNFFDRLDLRNGDIEQKIITMHRRKGLQYYKDSKSREKSRVKEFLTYNVRLNAYDWLQNPISCKLEHQGLAWEPESRIQISSDKNGRQSAQYVFSKLRDRFYIDFSKSNVDLLIKKTNSDKNVIKYYCFVHSNQSNTSVKYKCDGYTYEQFLLSWAEFEGLAHRDGGPEGRSHWQNEKPKKVWVD